MKSIDDRLQEATIKLSDPQIFSSVGLGNEINFHVFDYDIKDHYKIESNLKYLETRNDLNLIIIDVYDLMINILKEKGYLEKVFQYETTKGSNYINNIIIKTLGISSNSDLIINKIKNLIVPNKIIILKGLDKMYGILRGHTILNNLHSIVINNPLLLFYPGDYDKQSLKMFGILPSDNYYRAFQFVSRK